MGYTHYWTLKKHVTAATWADVLTVARRIVATAGELGTVLAGPNGEGEPEFGRDHFSFNGSAARFTDDGNDEAHEGLWIDRKRVKECDGAKLGFGFCKTARKPYDTAAAAILCALESLWPEHWGIGSDGTETEWQEGLALAKRALPEKGNQLSIPAEIVYDSQWVGRTEEGERYAIRQHRDGGFRITDGRVRFDPGFAIPIEMVRIEAEKIKARFGSSWIPRRERAKVVDRMLGNVLTRMKADDPSHDVGKVATLFAAVAGERLAIA